MHFLSASLALAPSVPSAHASPTSGGGWLSRVFAPYSRVGQMLTTSILSLDCRGTRWSGLGCHSVDRRERQAKTCAPKAPDCPLARATKGHTRFFQRAKAPLARQNLPQFLTHYRWHQLSSGVALKGNPMVFLLLTFLRYKLLNDLVGTSS